MNRDTLIPLSWPDLGDAETDTLARLATSARFGGGAVLLPFEAAFATATGRVHAVGVSGGTVGLWLTLMAWGIGAGDEVIVSPFTWHRISDAVPLAGATAVFGEIDYWRCTLDPAKLAQRITPRTRAIVAANTNGHPADWDGLRALADRHGLLLIEDSTEAVGSTYKGRPVGSFGDVAIFDLGGPGPFATGGAALVVLDDAARARALRDLRSGRGGRRMAEVPSVGAVPNDLACALALVQLGRLGEILGRRRQVARTYHEKMKSFEGIKDPYTAPDVTAVHWFLYVVHLGTRFGKGARDAIIEDLAGQAVEAAPFCHPAHLEPFHAAQGGARGTCPIAEKNGDRALALPFHARLSADDVAFVVDTLKDASVNVGAGASIYL
ncbi:MAG: DegT/DnrJ/EryC1/StrS family aminotransferase [Nitrospirae bacterium]|nr:DegT/DnrJ/EryC1/StrS family aminotransferase [Nitrospirota bacterium]